MNVLVDTNVVSELRRGPAASPRVLAWLETLAPENVYTSVVVLGEIRRGIALVARRDRAQSEALERWYAGMRRRLGNRVLDVDEAVMLAWAKLSAPDMMPAYDGLIAATALVHDLTLMTRNTADYRRAGITIVDPWKDRP